MIKEGFTWRGQEFVRHGKCATLWLSKDFRLEQDEEYRSIGEEWSAGLCSTEFMRGVYGDTPEAALELCREHALRKLGILQEIFKDLGT